MPSPELDASWTSYGHDAQLTGFTDAPLFNAQVKGFAPVWKASLSGADRSRRRSRRARRLRGSSSSPRRKRETCTRSETAAPCSGRSRSARSLTNGNCGIYGVSSTGAIDTARGVLYVIGASGMLHALRLSDGSEAPGWPVRVVSRTRTEYVWGGLRLVGSTLYVPVASYCDATDRRGVPAEGRLEAIDVSDPSAAPAVFDPVPGPDNLGGVWGWGGVAVSLDGGALYTGIGNAEPDVDNGGSDSMVELSADLSETFARRPPASPRSTVRTSISVPHPCSSSRAGARRCSPRTTRTATSSSGGRTALAKGPYARIPLSDGVDAFVGAPSWSPITQMLYDSTATAIERRRRVSTARSP